MSAILLAGTGSAIAATDIADTLTAYTGSTGANNVDPALNLNSLEASSATSTITFGPTGATFGSSTTNAWQGRNYLRTIDNDYYTKDFTATVKVNRPASSAGAYFGLGNAAKAFWNAPDRRGDQLTQLNASVFLELQDGHPGSTGGFFNAVTRINTDTVDAEQAFVSLSAQDPPFPTSGGPFGLKMVYSVANQTLTYSLDNGADDTYEVTLPPVDVTAVVVEMATGDRSSIYFGGDQGALFTDFQVTTSTPTAPPAPAGLVVTSVGDSTVSLSWTPSWDPDLSTYTVYRSESSGNGFSAVSTSPLLSPSFTDTGLINDTEYFYLVTQTSTSIPSESAFSAEASATPSALPPTPSNLNGLSAGDKAVRLDWIDAIGIFDFYTVYRSDANGENFTNIATGLTSSIFLDTNVPTNSDTYSYYVTTTKGTSESAPGNTVGVVAMPLEVNIDFGRPTDPVETMSAAAPTSGNHWNGVPNATTVPNLLGSSNTPVAMGVNVSSGGGAFGAPSGWAVGGNMSIGSETLTQAPALMQDYIWRSGATATITLTNLVPDQTYDLYLYGYGDSDGQNCGFDVNSILKQTSDPIGLTVLVEGRHYVTYSAIAESDGTITIVGGSLSQFSGLVDADNSSPFAGISGIQILENPDALAQPANLFAMSGDAQVDLAWDENFEAPDSYNVYRSNTPAYGYTFLASAGASNSYTDTTVTNGNTYYYVVTAVKGTRESFISAEATGTPTGGMADADSDGLSDEDEALIGTDPNDPSDFVIAKTSSVTLNGGTYDISITLNGAQGKVYHIERSTTLLPGSWTQVTAPALWTWTTGVLDDNVLSATGIAPAPGGKEFFRAVGNDTP